MEILQTQNPKARMATLGAFLLLPFLGLGIWYWRPEHPIPMTS
jgi:hypothetical protein